MIEERTRTMKEVVGGTQSPSGREGSKDKAFPEAGLGADLLLGREEKQDEHTQGLFVLTCMLTSCSTLPAACCSPPLSRWGAVQGGCRKGLPTVVLGFQVRFPYQ